MTNGETPITLIGNLTADPELRYTQNGLAVASFTIAQTPRFFDKQSNEWKDGAALFMRCAVWREFAEHVAASLTKGTRVVASGVLQVRNWETPEGEKRSGMEMKVEAIGADLRYATASVTRAQAPASQSFKSPESASQDSWAATQPGGGYGDDTPF